MQPLDGAVPSPNIWHHPEIYELENRSVDPDRHIEAAMADVLGDLGWAGRDVLDLGCGTGFHLARWAREARHVYGVEPHPTLAAVAARRTSRLGNVTVLPGTAQRVPLAPATVDVMQARWAYFFGPGCEPGEVGMRLDAVHRTRLGGPPGQVEPGAAAEVEQVGPCPAVSPAACTEDVAHRGLDVAVGVDRAVLELVGLGVVPDVRARHRAGQRSGHRGGRAAS